MAQLEAQRQQYQPLKKEGLTAQEYYEGAVRFEQEGDHENALKAYKVASEMGRDRTADVTSSSSSRKPNTSGAGRCRKSARRCPKSGTRITQSSSTWHGSSSRTLGFTVCPKGFQLAAEVASHADARGLAQGKGGRDRSLKAELEKDQRKGQPAKGGFASPRTGDKDFDDMSLDEQEAQLRHMTAEADSWR